MAENLYFRYFQAQKRYMPYADEEAFRSDLFSFLDMALFMGETRNTGKDAAAKSVADAKNHIESRLANSSLITEFCYLHLMKKMRFSDWERFLFLLAFAPSYDAKYEAVFARLQGDANIPLATLKLAVSLYRMWETVPDAELARALQKKGVLFLYFLETSEAATGGVLSFQIRLRGRVCAFLYGQNEPDEDLTGLAELFCFDDKTEPMLIRLEKKNAILSALQSVLENPSLCGNVIQIYGAQGIGKRFLVKMTAKEIKTNVLFVNLSRLLAATIAELRILSEKLLLESILLSAILCLYGYEETVESAQKTGLAFLLDGIERNGLFVLWLSEKKADYLKKQDLHVIFFELPMLTVKERERLWNAYASGFLLDDEVDLRLCANQYILTPKSIKDVLQDAALRAKYGERAIQKEDIKMGVEAQAGAVFGKMAARIRCVYTWEDLVIGDAQKKQMEQICNHVKYRSTVGEDWGFYEKTSYGRGVCALFYGEPGTGKTMAVQVIANELGLELYRIDLSQILSKYIGETEKNITDLFERAANTNALLFFDEADALFAKRAGVKDAHDRNANAETAHLLQKLEDYEGITILATNFINNIDDAFKRRIKFTIHFAFPDFEARLELWKTILPEKLPVDEPIDFTFFAQQFELSGSSIKEILTNAAFYAAADGRGLRNKDIVLAVKQNLEKYGKLLKNEDFGYLGMMENC